MRRSHWLIAVALAALLVPLCAGPAAAKPRVAVCHTYPWMRNVPRGNDVLAVPNRLCIERVDRGSYKAYRALMVSRPPHRIQVAARFHVELASRRGTIGNSREYVVPWTPLYISTLRYKRRRHGRLCARLWNHDGLGFYLVESVCHRF